MAKWSIKLNTSSKLPRQKLSQQTKAIMAGQRAKKRWGLDEGV